MKAWFGVVFSEVSANHPDGFSKAAVCVSREDLVDQLQQFFKDALVIVDDKFVSCAITNIDLTDEVSVGDTLWVSYSLNWETSSIGWPAVFKTWAEAAAEIVDDSGLESSWKKTPASRRQELFAEANDFDGGMFADKVVVQ